MGWTDLRLLALSHSLEAGLVLVWFWSCQLIWRGVVWVDNSWRLQEWFPGPHQNMPENRPDPKWNSSPHLVSGDHKARTDLGTDPQTLVHWGPLEALLQALSTPSGRGWDHTSVRALRFRARADRTWRAAAPSSPGCVSTGPLCFPIVTHWPHSSFTNRCSISWMMPISTELPKKLLGETAMFF